MLKRALHQSIEHKMSLLNAMIYLANFCTFFMFTRDDMLRIAFTWLGLPSIPLFKTRCPKKFPKVTLHEHLARLSSILNWSNIWKVFLQVWKMSMKFFWFKNVITKYFHRLSQLISKHFVHQLLISSSSIYQSKRHYLMTVSSMFGDKRCFYFISWIHFNLIVAWENVK